MDIAAVDAWLAEYETGFEKLALAQQRPECVFEGGISFRRVSWRAIVGRGLSRVVVWRARRRFEQRDLDRPLGDLAITLRFSRDLRPRGGMLAQFVSVYLDRLCCRELAQPLACSDGLSLQQCDDLRRLLSEHEAKSRGRFAEAMKWEYLWTQGLLHDLQYRVGDLSPEVLKESDVDASVDSPLDCLRLLLGPHVVGTGPVAEAKYGEECKRLPPDHPLLAGWTVDGKLMSDDAFAKEVDAMNRVFATVLAAANQTTLQQLRLSRMPTPPSPCKIRESLCFLNPPGNPSPWHCSVTRSRCGAPSARSHCVAGNSTTTARRPIWKPRSRRPGCRRCPSTPTPIGRCG